MIWTLLILAFIGTVAGTAYMIRRAHMDMPNEPPWQHLITRRRG